MAANFRKLIDNLAELSTVPSRCAAAASESIGKLIDEEFSQGHDPYGNAWAALRPATIAKGRSAPPLTDTGHMRDSVSVKPTQGSGIEVTVITPYSGFHQSGTKDMVPRPILPDQSELPEEWLAAIDDAYKASLKGKL